MKVCFAPFAVSFAHQMLWSVDVRSSQQRTSPASAKIFKLLSLGRRRSRLDQVWPRLIRFGNLTVQISILACALVPPYITAHAILLSPLPTRLVLKPPF